MSKILSLIVFVGLISIGFGESPSPSTSCLKGKGSWTEIRSCNKSKTSAAECGNSAEYTYKAPCVGTRDGKPDKSVCDGDTLTDDKSESCNKTTYTAPNGTTSHTCGSFPPTQDSLKKCRCRSNIPNCTAG